MSNKEQARAEYIKATEQYLTACELKRDDMLVTDVMVIVGQRGFADDSGTSLVVSMIPTETAQSTAIGLLRMATIEHDERAASLYRWANSGDDD